MENKGNTDIQFLSILHQESILKSIDKDAWYYNMNHKNRGKAIIFNHEKFEIGNFQSRAGSRLDCFNLESSLQKLGFDVTPYVDLTLDQLDKTLDYWAKEDHSQYDCLLMVILSHGDKGIIYAKDGVYKPEDKLWERFTDDKCPTLVGKPKLFFIQACQGDRFDRGVTLRTQVDGSSSFMIPMNVDFLVVFGSVPGFYSWRNVLKGSWLIQALCNAFDKYGFTLDLLTLLTYVNRQVAIEFESSVPNDVSKNKMKETIFIISKLTKLVKFEKK